MSLAVLRCRGNPKQFASLHPSKAAVGEQPAKRQDSRRIRAIVDLFAMNFVCRTIVVIRPSFSWTDRRIGVRMLVVYNMVVNEDLSEVKMKVEWSSRERL
jgi:hypothetical protein